MSSSTPSIPRGRAALTGLLAAVAALGVGHFVGGLTGTRASPFVAVGNTAIDLTPHPVKDFAIRWFGVYDKVALLAGMAVVIALLAVVAGLLSRRRGWPGAVLIAVFGMVGVASVLTRPDLPGVASLAPIVALLTGVGTFLWLHRLARTEETGPQAEPGQPNRRQFLASSATVVIGAGVAGIGGQLFQQGTAVESSRRAVGTLVPAVKAPPIAPGADFAASGTPTFLTSNARFYRIDTALSVPQLRAEDWRLRLHGLVEHELTLRFEDLLRRRLEERTITLTCVSNEVGGPLISTANFLGVPLRDLLLEAGVRPGAQQLFSTSADGWTTGTPLDVLLEPDRGALLAIGMNGEPLPADHGFPARIVVPGLYGYVSATKWVVDAEVTTFDRRHYWEERGWAKEAPIKTQSRIDRPQPNASVPAGPVTVAGIAWAQHTGIDRVEISVDGGPWRPAELATDVSRDTWRMWRATVDLPPGGHTVECRATDRTGTTQPAEQRPSIPDGATGWHSVSFGVR